MDRTKLFLRIDFSPDVRLGPGKIALLEAVAATGSIAAAARQLGMGYRTAWLLIDSLNTMFEEPAVATLPGRREGGSEVTEFGLQLIQRFHRMEALARQAIREEEVFLRRKLK